MAGLSGKGCLSIGPQRHPLPTYPARTYSYRSFSFYDYNTHIICNGFPLLGWDRLREDSPVLRTSPGNSADYFQDDHKHEREYQQYSAFT